MCSPAKISTLGPPTSNVMPRSGRKRSSRFFSPPVRPTPKRYFEFELNPLGTLFDAVVDNPHSRRDDMVVDPSWDCPGIVWRVEKLAGQDWRAAFWLSLCRAGDN